MYRDQENALNNGTFKQYNDPSNDVQQDSVDVGYLFDSKPELKELLENYTENEQKIIYYHLFMDITLLNLAKMRILGMNLKDLKKTASTLIEKLRYDKDLYRYLKESVDDPIITPKPKKDK
jgi:hypothetical protein